MIAPWLERQLTAAGRWNTDGVSRNARSRRCADCGAWTVTGLDADLCAWAVACDPTPISALGEAFVLLDGRRTFRVRPIGFIRVELDARGDIQIAANPAGVTCDVVAEHRCHAPPLPSAPTVHHHRLITKELPHDPPF